MAPLDSPPAHALQQQSILLAFACWWSPGKLLECLLAEILMLPLSPYAASPPYLTSGQQQLQGAHEHRPPAQQGSQGASQQYLLEIEQQLQQMSELDQTPAQQGRQGLPQPYREPVSSAPQRPRTQQGAIVIQLPGGVPTATGAHSFDEMRPAAYSTPPVSLAQEAAIQLGSQQVVIRPSVDSLLPTTTGGAPQQHVSVSTLAPMQCNPLPVWVGIHTCSSSCVPDACNVIAALACAGKTACHFSAVDHQWGEHATD